MEAMYQPIVRMFFAAVAFALTLIAFVITPLFLGAHSTIWLFPLDPLPDYGIGSGLLFLGWFSAGILGKAFMAGEARFQDEGTNFEYASIGLSALSLLCWVGLCLVCFSTKLNPFSAGHLPFVAEVFFASAAFSMPAVDVYNLSYYLKDLFTARLSASA